MTAIVLCVSKRYQNGCHFAKTIQKQIKVVIQKQAIMAAIVLKLFKNGSKCPFQMRTSQRLVIEWFWNLNVSFLDPTLYNLYKHLKAFLFQPLMPLAMLAFI